DRLHSTNNVIHNDNKCQVHIYKQVTKNIEIPPILFISNHEYCNFCSRILIPGEQ
ncbi:unnamed protein product, partial [Tenebrio molitor]